MQRNDHPDIFGYRWTPGGSLGAQTALVDINYHKRPRRWGLDGHRHEYLQFLVVVSGTLTITAAGESHTLTAGCASLIPPGVEHALFSPGGYEQIGADVLLDAEQDLLGLTALLREHVHAAVVLKNVGLAAQRETMTALLANGSPLSITRAASLITQSLLECVERLLYDGKERFDRELSGFLEAHLDGHLTTDAIARHFHLSTSHLERLSRQHFGMGVIALYNHKRFSRASVLLRLSDLTVGEIGQRVGFSEASNFSAFFARHAGMPPSRFRQQSRSEQ